MVLLRKVSFGGETAREGEREGERGREGERERERGRDRGRGRDVFDIFLCVCVCVCVCLPLCPSSFKALHLSVLLLHATRSDGRLDMVVVDKPPWVSHNGESIFSVHCSPQDAKLATGGGDHSVRIWDMNAIRQVKVELKNATNGQGADRGTHTCLTALNG